MPYRPTEKTEARRLATRKRIVTAALEKVASGGYASAGVQAVTREAGVAARLQPEDDLPALYTNAAVLAMPSLHEGFGLPCVEAMACGTPVVASDRAALPEACGGAALLADPADPDGFGAALVRAADPERARLRSAGLKRARALSWERTAELADAAVEEALLAA